MSLPPEYNKAVSTGNRWEAMELPLSRHVFLSLETRFQDLIHDAGAFRLFNRKANSIEIQW